ncbi:hypothetical protein HGP17_26310 [Rhizobium sp. P38BS-XIX]|uniref:SecDF P1 head subdomain-containing protein n=1 Tax=Rhizobium sp. P38BS-XIX TaxID=2726740 RepID=UPI001456DD80|nr:hypothetical protein [Rhizobium sp. P38BS-XIX]NLS00356.1 hypothetical protein [Rhizobium sp. P38BS-XIX]
MVLWLFACCALSMPAWSAESITIPAYAPAVGVEQGYKIQKATETDMSLWFDKPGASSVTMRGVFNQRMRILSRDANGLRVVWSLHADLPGDLAGAADGYQMNALYQNSLAAYGVEELELETDLNGYPRALSGADQIKANLRKMAATTSGDAGASDSTVSSIVRNVEANPLFVVNVLVPEAGLIAMGQAYQDQIMDMGQELVATREEDYGGVRVPITSTWKLESSDPSAHTAVLSLVEKYDSTTFSLSQQAAIAKLMDAFPERVKSLTVEQLTSAKQASKNRNAKFVMSLKDGSTLEASEIVTVVSGGTTLRTYTHIQRADLPTTLAIPSVLTTPAMAPPQVAPVLPSDADQKVVGDPSKATAADTQAAASPADGNTAAVIEPIELEVKSAKIERSPVSSYASQLSIELTADGAAKFRDFTQAAIGRQTQVLIDGKVVIEPWIREPIMGGRITISDGANVSALQDMAKQLAVPNAKIRVQLSPQ